MPPGSPDSSAWPRPGRSARPNILLDADEAIRLLDETGDVRWADPLSAERPKILLGRPTGNRASLSDIHRYFVLPSLGEQVAHRWEANALESFADIDLQQLRRVAGQHHADCVTNFQ
jgi:hypothetical protein